MAGRVVTRYFTPDVKCTLVHGQHGLQFILRYGYF